SVATGKIEHAPPADRPCELDERGGRRVGDIVADDTDVEVGDLVVARHEVIIRTRAAPGGHRADPRLSVLPAVGGSAAGAPQVWRSPAPAELSPVPVPSLQSRASSSASSRG